MIVTGNFDRGVALEFLLFRYCWAFVVGICSCVARNLILCLFLVLIVSIVWLDLELLCYWRFVLLYLVFVDLITCGFGVDLFLFYIDD